MDATIIKIQTIFKKLLKFVIAQTSNIQFNGHHRNLHDEFDAASNRSWIPNKQSKIN